MSTLKDINIQNPSPSERIFLAEKLWDSIAINQDDIEVSDAQKQVLEERMVAYHTSTDAGISWEEVKNEME